MGSSARSPMRIGRISRTDASTSALPVMALPTPTSPSSVMTSTMVLRSSSGLRSLAQPPSTVPPDRPVSLISTIFMGLALPVGEKRDYKRQNRPVPIGERQFMPDYDAGFKIVAHVSS